MLLRQPHLFDVIHIKMCIRDRDNYLRITVGTREQMEKMFEFLRNWLKGEQ